MIDARDVYRILGGRRAVGREVRTVRELRLAVEDGLPVEALDSAARYVAGDERGAAEIRYGIVPKTTLHRRERLTSEESQRLERLARVAALAEQVWEDRALAHEFLTSPQPQLGDERPIDLARTDLGAREVEELLMGMEYSLPV
ncbi:MAG TPA: antitoxin Xre/MbcA/ParS toxin-binding domain-containing protein [Longimicrobiaceae bacterium]|nr:antitoxin Xre/MbcA/ParS toxin-binding domain-containing protein [Longimicrobiaceae bacterium]